MAGAIDSYHQVALFACLLFDEVYIDEFKMKMIVFWMLSTTVFPGHPSIPLNFLHGHRKRNVLYV